MPLSRLTTLVGGSLLGAALVAERRHRRAAERLGAALFETLLNAIDANDTETGRHVRRVAAYALVIADAAGLPDATAREVEHVALFHDVGKIHEALFDIVHENSRRLSAAARQAIATHPHRGAEVLEPLTPFYPHLAEGVLSHHERWDGTGYPRGIAGEAIPLTARIVSIADSFDAITHARRYSAGKSTESAREAIARGRGTQFDPALVDLFLDPSVQQAFDELRREQWRPRLRSDRRHRRAEALAPEVSFRWRERIADQENVVAPASTRRRTTEKRSAAPPAAARPVTSAASSEPAGLSAGPP